MSNNSNQFLYNVCAMCHDILHIKSSLAAMVQLQHHCCSSASSTVFASWLASRRQLVLGLDPLLEAPVHPARLQE